jgi:hypothetical protein
MPVCSTGNTCGLVGALLQGAGPSQMNGQLRTTARTSEVLEVCRGQVCVKPGGAAMPAHLT